MNIQKFVSVQSLFEEKCLFFVLHCYFGFDSFNFIFDDPRILNVRFKSRLSCSVLSIKEFGKNSHWCPIACTATAPVICRTLHRSLKMAELPHAYYE